MEQFSAGSLDGPGHTRGNARPASGLAPPIPSFFGHARAYLATARMPMRGIVAEARMWKNVEERRGPLGPRGRNFLTQFPMDQRNNKVWLSSFMMTGPKGIALGGKCFGYNNRISTVRSKEKPVPLKQKKAPFI